MDCDASHGQAVKTVAYLRVSTAQQDVGSQRQAHGRVPYDPLQLHEYPRAQTELLACISVQIWLVPLFG